MTPKQVISHYGGPKKSVALAARNLRCTRAIIYHWIREGSIPAGRQAMIELATKGALKASRK